MLTPFLILGGLLGTVLLVFYAERKFAGFIQDRYGPMEVGKYGSFQAFADLLKLLQKEEIIPSRVAPKLFKLAPMLIFVAAFSGFAVMPFGPGQEAVPLATGVFFLFAIVSLDVVGMLLSGWASANKYSLYGSLRAVAQMVSYELPMGMIVLAVAVFSQSLSLTEISLQQGIFADRSALSVPNHPFSLPFIAWDTTALGGFLTWNLFRLPILMVPAFVIYYLASLAECNRAPFDLPEAESELVGGFHTEYSGFRWSIFFLAEYAMMILVAMVGVCLFLGGWNSPLPNLGAVRLADWSSGAYGHWSSVAWGLFWLLGKTVLWVLTHIWMRWTYPRLRIDQLMYMSWKVFVPFATLILLLCAVWRVWLVS